jgi:hypothetical protein
MMKAFVATAALLVSTPPAPGAASVHGSLDGLTAPGAVGGAVGWAADDGDPLRPVTVRFYLDAQPPQGVLLGSTVTDQPRPDLKIAGVHGFSFTIPDTHLDNATHRIFGFAVDNGTGALVSLLTSPKTGRLRCGFSTCPTLPISSNAGGVSIRAVGRAEFVWQHSVDSCGPGDGADSPARAFRDASGRVILTAANAGSTYRRVGTSLDNVKMDCAGGSIMGNGNDTSYTKMQDNEWPNGPYSLDGTRVYTLVHNEWHHPELLNPRCKPGDAWVNGITVAESTDGGRRFSHPADYKVREPPAWSDAFMCGQGNATGGSQFGSFEPTNIVEKDGYFYAIFDYISAPVAPYTSGRGPAVGDCVMRTKDLAKGSAWQVWMGNETWASAHTTEACRVIENDPGMDLKTLSYNTYLQAFIGVGEADSGAGFGYALSTDLVTWSPFVPFLASNASWGGSIPQGSGAYISLLDPTEAGLNLERSGREPYVYMTLLQNWPHYDIIRQRISITRAGLKSDDVAVAPDEIFFQTRHSMSVASAPNTSAATPPPWLYGRGISRFDTHGKFFMTVGRPEDEEFFSCKSPLLVPNQPYSSDSSFNICGTYDNPDNDGPTKPGTGYNYTNMFTATAFAAGNNLDVNAIVGTIVARKANTGGAGIGGMGHAEHRMAVAHGIELEADCHAPGTNCDQARSALFLAGGGNGGLAIQSFQEWRSSAAVNSPRQGILLGSGVPINPFQSAGGAVMRSAGKHVRADFGIDLRQMVANKASFASEGFTVDGTGHVTAATFRCAAHGTTPKELCATAAAQAATIAAQEGRIQRLEAAVARLELLF